jgi:hypothetical protein
MVVLVSGIIKKIWSRGEGETITKLLKRNEKERKDDRIPGSRKH